MRLTHLSTLIVLASFAGLSTPSFAQDEPEDTLIVATAEDNFMAADLDQDGKLDPDEFVSYAVIRSKAGDESYRQTLMTGEYDAAFVNKDADASGGLTKEEVGAVSVEIDTDGTDVEVESPELDEMAPAPDDQD